MVLVAMASTTSGMMLSSPLEDRLTSWRQLVFASTFGRFVGSLDTPSSLFDTFKLTPVTFGFTDKPSSRALYRGSKVISLVIHAEELTYDMMSPFNLQLERLREWMAMAVLTNCLNPAPTVAP